MQVVADKWLAARRLTDAPSTVEKLEIAVRKFGEWLAEHRPMASHSTSPVTTAWPGPSRSPRPRPRRPAVRWARSPGFSASRGLSQLFRDAAALGVRRRPRLRAHHPSRRSQAAAADPALHPRPRTRIGDARHQPDHLPVPAGGSADRPLVGGPPTRSGTCRWTAWTTTPTGPRGCGFRAARPTKNASSLSTRTPPTRSRPSSTCARAARNGRSPTLAPASRSATCSWTTASCCRSTTCSTPDPAGVPGGRAGRPGRQEERPGRPGHHLRPQVQAHRRDPARRTRRQAAYHHEGPGPLLGLHGPHLRPDQRPGSPARLQVRPGSRRGHGRAGRARSEVRRPAGRSALAQDQLLQDRARTRPLPAPPRRKAPASATST